MLEVDSGCPETWDKTKEAEHSELVEKSFAMTGRGVPVSPAITERINFLAQLRYRHKNPPPLIQAVVLDHEGCAALLKAGLKAGKI